MSALIKVLRTIMPPLSRTEQEALESGTTSWDAEILSGNPNWKKMLSLKKPQLSAEEQAFIDGPTEELCKKLDSWKISNDGDLSKDIWDFLKQEKFFGMVIGKEYGGLGFSAQGHSAVIMKIASRNLAAAVTVMVPNSLGPAELLHHYGTKEQKDYYLPRLATGVDIPCFALTEPGAGSDATSITSHGRVFKDTDGELKIKLNWEKRYITLGPVATVVGLAFQLEDPDNLLGKNNKNPGITCALIPADTQGINIGNRHHPMNLPFHNGPNTGTDVVIPVSAIIGGSERAGQGWRMLMESLAVGRSISLPGLSTAAMQLAGHITGAYSRVRRQFNMQIGKFEGIEEVLGRMAGTTYMINAARSATLQMVDEGQRPAVPSAIVKYHATENMRKAVDDMMDIHGGKAICEGPSNIMANMYQSVPVAITVEGANIMTRNLIIFGQGSVRAHKHMIDMIQAINNPDMKQGSRAARRLLLKMTGHAIVNMGRCLWLGITRGVFNRAPVNDKNVKHHYKQINRLSAAFNTVTDLSLMTLGGKLKRLERVSGRLGDVFSNLYMASSTLWHYEVNGRKTEDLPLVNWACTHALKQAENALDDVITNFPHKETNVLGFFSRLMRPLSFPVPGLRLKKPSDEMDKLAADIIREPGEARDRLSQNIFKPKGSKDYMAILEEAFVKSIATDPLEKKLSKALRDKKIEGGQRADVLTKAAESGALTKEEVEQLREMDRLRRAVIMVDDFPQEAGVRQNIQSSTPRPAEAAHKTPKFG